MALTRGRLGLRGRLVAITVVTALLAVTVLVVGLKLLLAHQSSQESLAALRDRADAAAATVRFRPGGAPRVLETPADSLDQNIWIFDTGRRRIDGGQPPRRLRADVDSLAASPKAEERFVGGGYRLLSRPVARPDGTPVAVVVAALDLAPYESSERRGLLLSLALGVLAVAGAGAAAWATSGYALSQVRRMARAADDWREHDLSGRFELGAPRDELTELADTLDRMLDRIAQAILTERRLTDEVAHELRTPLTVIRSEAQLALLEPGADGVPTAALDAIVAATDRMTASIDTMLSLARSRSTHADEARCSVRDVLTQVRAHAPAGADVEVCADGADEDLLLAAPLRVVAAAVVPVLDNAVRHAASRVRVHVTDDARRVLLHVEDDGDGVDAEHRDRIFEPGHSTEPDGSGLGLALSRRLAHSVGGEVVQRDGDHGHFVVTIPRA
ncbi:HAMP domain-containing sensor histidine kinase [soil metagenome]